ncbi:MAG: DUF2164 family protein [Candidatus Cloacimonetes bacterium]|nr:DUF2164 family protein [Candidatus Cloacimonadota bacterium]
MKKNKLELQREVREKMIVQIKKFFLNERNEEIGDLAAILLLDFITDNLGKEFYNKGIRDCITQLSVNIEDLKGLEL